MSEVRMSNRVGKGFEYGYKVGYEQGMKDAKEIQKKWMHSLVKHLRKTLERSGFYDFDVPIPPKEGEKTPCKRCMKMQFPDDELHIIKSIENGAMSDDEAKAVLMAVAMKKSRLHKECAESIVPAIIDSAKKHKINWY